jgi:hypothetical protein
MGTTQRTKPNGFLALLVAQKSACGTGGGLSGEFGARNSLRAGPSHPRGVRTEYNRRLARRRPPVGAAPPTHVRGVVWSLVYMSPVPALPAARCQLANGARPIAREKELGPALHLVTENHHFEQPKSHCRAR